MEFKGLKGENKLKVTILNPETLENLYKNHGEFACECYATPKKYAEKVGKSCENDGHMSGSRCEYIKFEIEADRGTLEQMMRSEIGVRYNPEDKYYYMDLIEAVPRVSPDEIVKNMQSFRYVDKNDFTYVTPHSIENDEKALALYQNCMSNIETTRKAIRQILIDEDGLDAHKAVEDANFVLPRATNTKLSIGFTPEALIRFMWKRLCTRAQDQIREVAIEMKKLVTEINPDFAKELVPHCQYLMWCPEGAKCCGAYPTRKELKEIINERKNSNN